MDREQFKLYIDKNPTAKLRDLVTQMLYNEIVSLRIAPGTKLNVNSIASALGISRTPVAEAIVNLCERGFVKSRADISGYFVIDLSMADMINLYDVRNAIECEAAALCTELADDATVNKLERLANDYRDCLIAKDYEGMLGSDMPFHALIVETCGNKYIQDCYKMLLPNLTMYQSSMLKFVSSNLDNAWSSGITYNHNAVVAAIKMRIPELARQAMANHISASLNYTMFCGGGNDPFANVRNLKARK